MSFHLKVNFVRLIISVAVLAGMIGTVPVRPAYAAPLLVSNTNDSGPGSLRQAILDAVSGDTITFAPALAGGTIALNSQLTISKDLTIDGSALDPQVTLSGQSASRIIEIIFNAQLTISSLVFTQGASTTGGAIHATGNAQLKLENSTFHQNQASLSGGAISVEGNSTGAIVNSIFSQNQAGSSGGAISIVENGNYTILHSTLVDNSASGNGGAVAGFNIKLIGSTLSRNSSGGSGGAVSAAIMQIDSTTMDRNLANFYGGAIALAGNSNSTIVNTTVTRNQANGGGGALATTGNIYLQVFNSTFAANQAPVATEVQVLGTGQIFLVNSILVCLPGDQACVYESAFAAIGSSNGIIGIGTLASFGLAELADNGGPTQTMALLPGSPLIDAGDDSLCANPLVNHLDQRGVTRPQGSHCDIGAYEKQFLIRYVKQDATAPNDGSSWAHAHTDLQSALAASSPDEEIWVAAGTYKPTSTADRTISFTLKNGVALYGGFVGTETSRTQRNYQANVTILSGDIGAQGDHSDNSYHVVVGSAMNNSAVLDGFTVANGKTNDGLGASPENMGGGMYNQNGDPSVSNVIFTGNQGTFGGGMYNGGDSGQPGSGSHPVLTNVTFQNNTGIEGGGMRNEN
jgi:predicted outer membrane repeat protein